MLVLVSLNLKYSPPTKIKQHAALNYKSKIRRGNSTTLQNEGNSFPTIRKIDLKNLTDINECVSKRLLAKMQVGFRFKQKKPGYSPGFFVGNDDFISWLTVH